MWTKIKIMFLVVGISALSAGVLGLKIAGAEDTDENQVSSDVIKVLPLSKHTLADGIKQATQGTNMPISAKFEMDDGKLSLSVYTANTQNNTFNEVAGSSDAETWTPNTEAIKGGEDLESAQQQLKIMSGAKFSLLDFVAKAQKDQPTGTILSAIPEFEGGKNVCEVRVLSQGKVVEIHYDVMSGEKANVE